MTEKYQAVLALSARILLSALFFYAALFNLLNWSEQVSHMAAARMPLPAFVIGAATTVEIVLGLPLLLGFQTRPVALLAAAYVLLCAMVLHPFWAATPGDQANQALHFFETLGAAGGFFAIAAFGPGLISMDARKSAQKSSV